MSRIQDLKKKKKKNDSDVCKPLLYLLLRGKIHLFVFELRCSHGDDNYIIINYVIFFKMF